MRNSVPIVHLIPLSVEDVPNIMTWVNDPDVMGYFANRQVPISEEEELAYVLSLLSSKVDRVWSVFNDEGEYVGQCSLNQIYWPARTGRVFLAVKKSMHNQGYGTAILQELIHKGFVETNLHKLWLIVRDDNREAQAKYIRAGFKFEGVLKDEYFVHNRYYDMVRMGYINPAH